MGSYGLHSCGSEQGRVVGSYIQGFHKMQEISCLASQEAQKYCQGKHPLLGCCLIKKFYAVIQSLMFNMNSYSLVRIFVINLVIFYTFLPLSGNCAVPVYLYVVTFACCISNWPRAAKPACQ